MTAVDNRATTERILSLDPMTAARLDWHQALVDHGQPWFGKIQIDFDDGISAPGCVMEIHPFALVIHASRSVREHDRGGFGGSARVMRPGLTAVACGLAVAMFAASGVPVIAQRPSPLDVAVAGTLTLIEPRAEECTFWWATLAEFAEKVHVRVGFETPPQCRIRIGGEGLRTTSARIAFEGLTPREVLDRLLETQPEFAWQDVDGVAVIRPIAAWKRQDHVLHARVAPFTIAGVHPHHALHTMLESAQPSLLLPHTDLQLSSLGRRLFDPGATGLIDEPVAVRFSGGTLLQALNALVEPFDGIWYVGYAGNTMNIVLGPPDFREGVTSIQVKVSVAGAPH